VPHLSHAKHTLPELDAHDLSHQDAYRAAARLIADHRPAPAFTLHTLPPVPALGETATIRRACTTHRGTDPAPTMRKDLALGDSG
jgi:hypothetical protein